MAIIKQLLKRLLLIILLTITSSIIFANPNVRNSYIAEGTYNTGLKIYAVHQHKAKDVIQKFTDIEKSYSYVREKTNNNDGIEVEMFLKSVGLPKGFAWCAAFIYYSYSEACKKYNVPISLYKSAGVKNMYKMTIQKGIVVSPNSKLSNGMILAYEKPQTVNGHITTILEETGKFTVKTIEGNTSPPTNTNSALEREGGGVYIRIRDIRKLGNMVPIGIIAFYDSIHYKTKRPIINIISTKENKTGGMANSSAMAF